MFRNALVLLGLLLSTATAGVSQQAATSADSPALGLEGRAELEMLLQQLDSTIASTAYSAAMRRRARDQAALIRDRLEVGDYRTGDRILMNLSVRGQPVVRSRTDTLEVQPGPELVIESENFELQLPAIDLSGVLRAELEQRLNQEISRYLREPKIDGVQTLVRLIVIGEVTEQGEIFVPAEERISAAIGRLPSAANFEGLEIRRGEDVLWDKEAVREAIRDGRTVDEMSLRAGDEIIIPLRAPRQNWLTVVQITVGLVTAIGFAYQIFGSGR